MASTPARLGGRWDRRQRLCTSTLSAAAGSFSWSLIEYFRRGKPSILGLCSAQWLDSPRSRPPAVCHGRKRGWHRPGGGAATYFACNNLKARFGYDDSLDTFGVHAVGARWEPF